MPFFQEKGLDTLPFSTYPVHANLGKRWRALGVILTSILFVVFWPGFRALPTAIAELSSHLGTHDVNEATCPQVDVLVPDANAGYWKRIGDVIASDAFKARAIDWLSSAVQIPTESYDDLGPVGVDTRWEAFGPFHAYLFKAFPQVHASLKLTKVNTYGLLYEWTGSDSSLKPFLLVGHQDVVPVDPKTVDKWTHPPYSGHYDGKLIWGRGSSDDKSGVIGIMSAITLLLEQGFKPTRTAVIALGFDEEISGYQGAGHLAQTMLETYGKDSFAFVIDEGGGIQDQYGTTFATPGIAEKGYLDTRIEVASPGGHSSVPPTHTSIGILSALLVKLEQNPSKSGISTNAPIHHTFQCYAEHAKAMPSELRKAVKSSAHSEKALKKMEKLVFDADETYKSVFGTTQAVDLIGGGVKTNALPEQAWAIVNHRIQTLSSVNETMRHDTDVLKDLAHEFNLTYEAFGTRVSSTDGPSKGTLVLSDAYGAALEPAPRTPTSGDGALPFKLLSGTIKATYSSHRGLEGDNIPVAPWMPNGNTDTRYYWGLSAHIFRYNHKRYLGGLHTVNEYMTVDSFLEMIRFFETLILNADESKEL